MTLTCLLIAAALGLLLLGERPMTPGVVWSMFALTLLATGGAMALLILSLMP